MLVRPSHDSGVPSCPRDSPGMDMPLDWPMPNFVRYSYRCFFVYCDEAMTTPTFEEFLMMPARVQCSSPCADESWYSCPSLVYE